MDILGMLPSLLEEFQNIDEEEFDGTFLGLKGLSSSEIEILSSHVDEEENTI